jgi:RecB family endonuclease NucS
VEAIGGAAQFEHTSILAAAGLPMRNGCGHDDGSVDDSQGWCGRTAKRATTPSVGPYPAGVMRLVIATCSVDYDGRLTAHLPLATRLLMVKADGSISIHADDRAYKPLNWMNPPCKIVEEDTRWVVTSTKGETLTITIEEVHADVVHDLGVDPGLQKDGVEAHLQELLAADPTIFGEGMVLVRREYPTDIGPVDLLCRDANGAAIAIEVKRSGDIDGVEQLARYLERLDLDGRLRPVRGIFAAQRIKPQAKVLAESRGITCIEVDYDALRGIERDTLTLF